MLAVSDQVVAAALERWDPALLATASSQFANLVQALRLCLRSDPSPHRVVRLLLPMFAAVHQGRADEVARLGEEVLSRWPQEHVPLRPEALAVLASAAAIAGRSGRVEALAIAVNDDPTASPIAAALADRAWGLARRDEDPELAVRHFRLARLAAARVGARSLAGELQCFEAGQLDLAGQPDAAVGLLADVLSRAVATDDRFLTVLARLMRSRLLLRAADADGAAGELAALDAVAASTSGLASRPWWSAAILRTAAAVVALGPGGWSGSAVRWREAIDQAASDGEIGELAITLRAAAATAWHVGARDDGAELWASVPPVAAVTVLAELFPDAVAELQRCGPNVGHDVVAGLARARAVLDRAASAGAVAVDPDVRPDGRESSPSTATMALEGDGWRIVWAGRATFVRHMKGIGDLAVLLGRPGVEVHALELMGAPDVGGAPGPVLDDRAKREYQTRMVDLQRDIDEARGDHDGQRAERAEMELDALVEQLSEAFGLGGRGRTTGSSAERARSAVTYRVRTAIKKLAEGNPELGRHLAKSVRTGTWCSYQPETDVSWTIDR